VQFYILTSGAKLSTYSCSSNPPASDTSLPQNCHSFVLLPNEMKMQSDILNIPYSIHIHQQVTLILNNIPPWDAKTTETTVTTHSTGDGDK
jgi:hypothetical protein